MATSQSSSMRHPSETAQPSSRSCSPQSCPDEEWTLVSCTPIESTNARREDIAINYTAGGTGTAPELAGRRRPATPTATHQPQCYCCQIHRAAQKSCCDDETDVKRSQWLSAQYDLLARRRDQLMQARTKASTQRQQYGHHRDMLEETLIGMSNPFSNEGATETVGALQEDVQKAIMMLRNQSKLLDDADNEVLTIEFNMAGEEARFAKILHHASNACHYCVDEMVMDSLDDDVDDSISESCVTPDVLQRLYDRIGDAGIIEERLCALAQFSGQQQPQHLNERELQQELLEAEQDIYDLEQQCLAQGIDLSLIHHDDGGLLPTGEPPSALAYSSARGQCDPDAASTAGLPHRLGSVTSIWANKAWEFWEEDRNDHQAASD